MLIESILYRPLYSDEGALLEQATLLNLNWNSDRFTIEDLREERRLAHYAELIPSRGDFGFVATISGQWVGVVWNLFLPELEPGFVASDIPELSVCVSTAQRGRGIGTQLVERALTEVRSRQLRAVRLSVEAGNPARRLYVRAGFVPAGKDRRCVVARYLIGSFF